MPYHEMLHEAITLTRNGRGLDQSKTVPYLIGDVTGGNEAAALNYLNSQLAFSDGDLSLNEVTITERIDANTYKAEARYERRSNSAGEGGDERDSSESFSTRAGTVNVKWIKSASCRTVFPPAGKEPPANVGDWGIDSDEEGNVNGCEIMMPVFSFSETHFFSPNSVSNSYKQALADLAGKVNSASFRGFSKGEVLFLGVEGSRSGDDQDDYWQITFNFSVQRNSTANIDGRSVNKEGWQFMWMTYKRDVDAAENIKPKVDMVFVDQVYDYGDFSGLRIGA